MGAGASAVENKLKLADVPASKDAQGKQLGVEFEVRLVRPRLKGVKRKVPLILRVAYESLVLCETNEKKTPLTYFKYQDIICWGSTSALFQFKLFGGVMGKDAPVPVMFQTTHGKTLEKVAQCNIT